MQNRNHMHTNWWRLRQKRCRDVTWRVQKHILVTYPWSVVGVDEILHYYNTRQSVIKLNWKIRIRTVDCSRTELHHAPKLWITSKRGTVWIVMQLFAHLRCVNCSFQFLCWCANIFSILFPQSQLPLIWCSYDVPLSLRKGGSGSVWYQSFPCKLSRCIPIYAFPHLLPA